MTISIGEDVRSVRMNWWGWIGDKSGSVREDSIWEGCSSVARCYAWRGFGLRETVSPMRSSATCQDARDVDGILNVGGELIMPLSFGSINRAPLHGAPSETPQLSRGGPSPLRCLRCTVEDNSARGGIGSTSPDGSGSREP